ncbi:MAG: glycosyltransferase family 39 protein [Alphaproteobacteria bacterium]
MIDALADRMGRMIATPRGFYIFVGLYIGAVFLARAVPFPGSSNDTAELLLHSQYFAWGYELKNPPLMSWLVIAAQKLFGVSLLSLEAVKSALLLLAYLFLYRAAREIFKDDRLAGLAALSLVALYSVAWMTWKYSHSVLVLTMCVVTFYALLRLDSRGDLASYVIFGVIAGLGLIAKYNYLLFVIALIVAAMTEPGLRARLGDRRILLSFAIALAIALPPLVWFVAHSGELQGLIDYKFQISPEKDRLGAAGLGLISVAKAYLDFLMPLIFLLGLFFWRAFTPLRAGAVPSDRWRPVLGISLLLMTAVILIGVPAFGASRFQFRYLYVFILFPIYFFARVQGIGAGERALNRFGAVLMLLGAIVPLLLLAKFWFEPLWCRKCPLHIPYPAFAEDIRRAGFERGTIVSHFSRYKNGGILRPFFPDARIVDLKLLDLADPPPNVDAGQCLLIWDDVDDPGVREGVIALAGRRFDVEAKALTPMQTIARPMVNGPKRIIRLGIIVIPGGAGKCR